MVRDINANFKKPQPDKGALSKVDWINPSAPAAITVGDGRLTGQCIFIILQTIGMTSLLKLPIDSR